MNERPNLQTCTFIFSLSPSLETHYDIENLIYNIDSMFLFY